MNGRASATAAFLAAALALASAAPEAHAGTYVVNACTVGATKWDNKSWSPAGATPAGMTADVACPNANDAIWINVAANARTPDGASQALVFRAPVNATIADFRLNRRLIYNDPVVDGTHKYYVTYALDDTVFAGAGYFTPSIRNSLNAQKSWYGYPSNTVNLPRADVTRANFPALAGYRNTARSLVLRVGCMKVGTPCAVGPGGQIFHALFAASVTVQDNTVPALEAKAAGLLAGGQRDGSDPVTVDASDNSGIRRIDLIDVTGGGAILVGSEDYMPGAPGATMSDDGAGCSGRLARACPNLTDETIRPTSLSVGTRQLVVRATDTAGNVSQQGPYTVDVGTPSDRGAFNGAGATDTGTLTARFAGDDAHRTVDYADHPKVEGRLVGDGGRPITGADLVVLTRDVTSDRYVERHRATTDSDGRFAFRVSAGASRLIQVGWRSHVNDTRFTLNAYVTMKVRARASLSVRRSVRLGRRFALTGRLYGVRPPGGVPIVAQGAGSRGGYKTFADGRTSRSGRFALHYRFRVPSSRGHTFRLRVKVLGRAGWPYLAGRTRTVKVRVR